MIGSTLTGWTLVGVACVVAVMCALLVLKVVRMPNSGGREALLASLLLVAALWAGKHLAVLPFLATPIFTLIAAFQLYAPMVLIERRGELPESHGIHAHGALLAPFAAARALLVRRRRQRQWRKRPDALSRLLAHYGRGVVFRPRALAHDLGWALWLCVLTFLPFALGHHWFQTHFGGARSYQFTIPPDLLATWAKNTFLVALPEELFYRGYVETRLERLWPSATRPSWMVPIGRATIVTAALFAVGHFVGEYNPARLGPFFPAFLFSWLTRRSGSIAGAVTYHGLSNAFSALLFAGYHR